MCMLKLRWFLNGAEHMRHETVVGCEPVLTASLLNSIAPERVRRADDDVDGRDNSTSQDNSSSSDELLTHTHEQMQDTLRRE
jgi:hypothetical protein